MNGISAESCPYSNNNPKTKA